MRALPTTDRPRHVGTLKDWCAGWDYAFIAGDDGTDVYVAYKAFELAGIEPVRGLRLSYRVELNPFCGRERAGWLELVTDE